MRGFAESSRERGKRFLRGPEPRGNLNLTGLGL